MNTKALTIGLIIDEISVADIVNWSDTSIYQGNYNDLFIDISFLPEEASKKQLVKILNKYAESFSELEFLEFDRTYLSFLANTYKDWKKIQKKLVFYYDLTNKNYKTFLSNNEYEFRIRLRDDYILRNDGFSGCMKMPHELNEYLEIFNKCSTKKQSFLNIILNKFGGVY